MRGTRLLRNLTLMAALGILGSRPVLANCDAASDRAVMALCRMPSDEISATSSNWGRRGFSVFRRAKEALFITFVRSTPSVVPADEIVAMMNPRYRKTPDRGATAPCHQKTP